jgi:hypothetical protein
LKDLSIVISSIHAYIKYLFVPSLSPRFIPVEKTMGKGKKSKKNGGGNKKSKRSSGKNLSLLSAGIIK